MLLRAAVLGSNLRIGTANEALAPVAPRIGDNTKLAVAQRHGAGAIRTQLEADRVQSQLQLRRGANEHGVHRLI